MRCARDDDNRLDLDTEALILIITNDLDRQASEAGGEVKRTTRGRRRTTKTDDSRTEDEKEPRPGSTNASGSPYAGNLANELLPRAPTGGCPGGGRWEHPGTDHGILVSPRMGPPETTPDLL